MNPRNEQMQETTTGTVVVEERELREALSRIVARFPGAIGDATTAADCLNRLMLRMKRAK